LQLRPKITIIKFTVIFTAILAVSSLLLTPSLLWYHHQSIVAQPYVETVKHRNLVIDLGNGLKTNAQLTLPAVGKGPFPAVLLVPGAGPMDMNYTQGFVSIDNKTGSKIYPPTQFFQIAQYLSERGFVVFRYDKRGIGENGTIINNNVWGNLTFSDLKQDAEAALGVLAHQPEVDAKRITVLGHSEGGEIATRIAIDNPITPPIKNIVLMAARIQNAHDAMYYSLVGIPLEYANQILDKNHTGSITIEQAVKDPIYGQYMAFIFANNQNYNSITSSTNNNTTTLNTLIQLLGSGGSTTNRQAVDAAAAPINIDKEFKPMLERTFESAFEASILDIRFKCEPMEGLCPIYFKSLVSLEPTLSFIGNISSSTDILMLHGENDSGSPVQQGFLLQQRLAEVNHPDHTLITYPNIGHYFYPSTLWGTTEAGSIPEYVLADLYAWLEAHSGFTSSYSSALIGNNNSSTNVASSSSGKKQPN
jgi:pimeloyl-ACP methyl ester carboxylesterase